MASRVLMTKPGDRLKAFVLALVLLLILAVAAGSLAAGGTNSGVAQLLFLPVVVAGATLGIRGGVLSGVIAGGLAGLIPLDTSTGQGQPIGRWLLRLVVLVAVGYVVGFVRSRLIGFSEARSRFISTVSHELRTPLTSVVGFSESLYERRAAITEPALVEMLGYVRRDSFAVSHTLDQMILAARLDIGTLTVDKESVDLRSTVTQVIENLPPIGRSLDIRFTGHAVAACDRLRTRQVVRNLLVHAAQVNGGPAQITLSSDERTAKVEFVHSGGPLVDDPELFLFAPLFDSKPREDSPVGRWLPLNVSRQLARLMGGDVTYSHHEGRSQFELTLPVSA